MSTDFVWTTARTSFSMDWDIYCGNEYKLALSSSLYYVGAVIGLLSSERIAKYMIFENIIQKEVHCLEATSKQLLFRYDVV